MPRSTHTSTIQNTDILGQEESRIREQFESYGQPVCLAVCRVFARFGHFRPLLNHLKLDEQGDLQSQQRTLLKSLEQNGATLFMQAIDKGVNPTELKRQTPVIACDDLPASRRLLAASGGNNRGKDLFPSTAAPDDLDDIDEIKPPVVSDVLSSDRRRNTPGRRQKVLLEFPEDRRKVPCRRTKGL